MQGSKIAVGVLAVLATTGCGRGASSTRALAARAAAQAQMNDLSLLYPLPTSEDEMTQGYLGPDAQGPRGVLLPEEHFAALSLPGDYRKLRLTAVRLDPCFANLGPIKPTSVCQPQMRLVFQALTGDATSHGGWRATAEDRGFHTFHALTTEEFFQALGDIEDLRTAAAGDADLGPLAVHPVMRRQGLRGAFAQGLNSVVLKYAGAQNLTRVAGFSTIFTPDNWDFTMRDIVAGKATPVPIPTLVNQSSDAVAEAHAGTVDGQSFRSLTIQQVTSPDRIAVMLDDKDVEIVGPIARQAAIDAAARIQNPNFHTPNDVDCVSCHAAPHALLNGSQAFQLAPSDASLDYAPDPIHVSAADFAQTTPVTPASLGAGPTSNLHAFSYLRTEPMIAQRVINETAAILAWVNAR